MFTQVYPFILMFTPGYSCLYLFTHVYYCLCMFTHVYPFLLMFTILFTLVNLCFLWSRTFEFDKLNNCDNFYYCVHHIYHVYSAVLIVLGIMVLYHDTYACNHAWNPMYPVTCLRGPRFLIAWNIHVSCSSTRGVRIATRRI